MSAHISTNFVVVDIIDNLSACTALHRRAAAIHVPFLIAGETLTGLVAALLATAQTDGCHGSSSGRGCFSVDAYFGLLAVIMLVSMAGFLVLEGRHLCGGAVPKLQLRCCWQH